MNEDIKRIIELIKGNINEMAANLEKIERLDDGIDGYRLLDDVLTEVENIADDISHRAKEGQREVQYCISDLMLERV